MKLSGLFTAAFSVIAFAVLTLSHSDQSDAVVNTGVNVTGIRANNPVLDISIGRLRQHTGQYRGQVMYDAMLGCLEELCPWGQGACNHAKTCKIKQVAYDDYRGLLAHNAHMNIKITESAFPGDGKREVLLGLTARFYANFTDSSWNNYDVTTWDFGDARPEYRFGNTAPWVKVELMGIGGHLKVSSLFNSNRREGPFHCEKGQNIFHQELGRKVLPDLNKTYKTVFGHKIQCEACDDKKKNHQCYVEWSQ